MTPSTLASQCRTYLAAFESDLAGKVQDDERLKPFVEALKSIDVTQEIRGPYPTLDHAAMGHLATSIRNATDDSELRQIALATAGVLDWSQLYGGGGMDEEIAEGMIAAQVAGSYGCFPSETVATGQFLLAPDLHYPLHTHAAVEIYYCMSGTLHLQHGVDGNRFTVEAGNYSITPSNRLHALWTGDEPVLLLYVWIDQVSAPIWVWEQGDDGQWSRSRWKRPPGEAWQVDVTELVSRDVMDLAHGRTPGASSLR